MKAISAGSMIRNANARRIIFIDLSGCSMAWMKIIAAQNNTGTKVKGGFVSQCMRFEASFQATASYMIFINFHFIMVNQQALYKKLY